MPAVRPVGGWSCVVLIGGLIALAGCGGEQLTSITLPASARVLWIGPVPESEEGPWHGPFQTERVVVDTTQASSCGLARAEVATLVARGWRRTSTPDPLATELVPRDKKRFAAVLTVANALRDGPPAYKTNVNTELRAEQRAARSRQPAILVIVGPM